MSRTVDDVFERDFKSMVTERLRESGGAPVTTIPVPSNLDMTHVKLRKRVYVRKIEEKFFDRLNKSTAELFGRGKLFKRQVLSDGSFRKDKDGNYVKDSYPVPNGSVAIISPISIGLKRFIEDDKGKKVEHIPTKGFGYVDYFEEKGKRKYIYVIPKEYAYMLNLCALVVSVNQRVKKYSSTQVTLVNGMRVYVEVIPYTHRDTGTYRLLAVEPDPIMQKHKADLFKHWSEKSLVFPPHLTNIEHKGYNLAWRDIVGSLAVEDYDKYSVPLSETSEEELDFGDD